MELRKIQLAGSALIGVVAISVIYLSSSRPGQMAEAHDLQLNRGVNLAGPEFGTNAPAFSNENPGMFGRDYTYNTEQTTQYFCERGFRLLRLPIRWERIQPRLGEDLDALELARLRVAVGWAKKHGGRVVIDLHNYGRYVLVRNGKPHAVIVDQSIDGETPVSRAHFADLWRRLARAFKSDSTVHSYGIMNEPHDMGLSSWKEISQAGVDAIRAEGDGRLLLVAGDGWSKAHTFSTSNGSEAWIKDSHANVAYEAHCYFDHDGSGRYFRSFDQESTAEADLAGRAVRRLKHFQDWCGKNNVRGIVGEYAVPGNDPRWLDVLKSFQTALDEAGMAGCYWAGGEWWANSSSAIQPRDGFRTDAPQMAVLAR
jgi:endoglucanase